MQLITPNYLAQRVSNITGDVTWQCPNCGTRHIMFDEDIPDDGPPICDECSIFWPAEQRPNGEIVFDHDLTGTAFTYVATGVGPDGRRFPATRTLNGMHLLGINLYRGNKWIEHTPTGKRKLLASVNN